MDYLDPKKQFRRTIMLYVGYVLIGIGIFIATIILLYQAYGFGLGKNGTVIQNGLVFFSSQPNPASIYLNGKKNKAQTNASLVLPSGIYNVQLEKNDYRTWQRKVELDGGTVEHFDYPVLFPNVLTRAKTASISAVPEIATQSRDRRWLLVSTAETPTTFSMFDLTAPKKAPTIVTLPTTDYTNGTLSNSWKVIAWADDNIHVLLQHTYDGKNEYIVLDRTNPDSSVNLTQTYSATPFSSVSFENTKYNQYYLYNAPTATLSSANLGSSMTTPVLSHVLGYASYGNNVILYATDSDSPAGKVLIRELSDGQTYDIRSMSVASDYLLDLTQYDGTFYVAVGTNSNGLVYIYQDPVGQLQNDPTQVAVPSQVLNVTGASYLSFSPNAQFIVAEAGARFGVYDIENKRGYNYTATQGIDSPQVNANWMDGDRLDYVSSGKLVVFDYDYTNQQVLVPAGAAYLPFFDTNYRYVYLLDVAQLPAYELDQYSLLAPGQQ